MKQTLILGLITVIGLSTLNSCEKKVGGCTDITADNYNSNANEDDGSCAYSKKVGESYQGGIIIYVDHTGQHGIIAAPSDQSDGIAWSNGNTNRTNAQKTAIYSGDNNTAQIINTFGDTGTYAAKLCNDLVLNGYDDWFLPSKSELKELYVQRELVSGLAEDFYWTSTENDNDLHWDLSWYQNMTTGGYQNCNMRSYLAHVRAVRIF